MGSILSEVSRPLGSVLIRIYPITELDAMSVGISDNGLRANNGIYLNNWPSILQIIEVNST
jgi:hypothetical protein